MDRGLVLRAVCPCGCPVRAAHHLLPALHFEGRQGVGGPLRAIVNSAIFSRTLGGLRADAAGQRGQLYEKLSASLFASSLPLSCLPQEPCGQETTPLNGTI